MISVFKVGILRDLTTGDMEGVLILQLPSGEEVPCAIAVDDAQVLLTLEEEVFVTEALKDALTEDLPEVSPLGPLNPMDKRAHAVPVRDGYGDLPSGPKVKVP